MRCWDGRYVTPATPVGVRTAAPFNGSPMKGGTSGSVGGRSYSNNGSVAGATYPVSADTAFKVEAFWKCQMHQQLHLLRLKPVKRNNLLGYELCLQQSCQQTWRPWHYGPGLVPGKC